MVHQVNVEKSASCYLWHFIFHASPLIEITAAVHYDDDSTFIDGFEFNFACI